MNDDIKPEVYEKFKTDHKAFLQPIVDWIYSHADSAQVDELNCFTEYLIEHLKISSTSARADLRYKKREQPLC